MPTAIQFLLADGGSGGLMDLLFPLVLVFLIFYFLVIRPSSRERRKREAQIKALKKNDRVVTNAGIHGSVMSTDDDTVVLRVDDKNNVRITFSRAAIWQVLPRGGGTDSSGSSAG